MKLLGEIKSSQSRVYVNFSESFDSLNSLDFQARHSVVLLVSDSVEVDAGVIYSVADHFLRNGLVYVCTWGDGCERVHDIFDEAEVGGGSSDSNVCLMSTWHSRDTLDEAIEFFLTWAIPPDRDLAITSYLAVVVGDRGLYDIVDQKITTASQIISA